MSITGIIGGSGLSALQGLEIVRQKVQQTPYGEASSALTFGQMADSEIIFLPRHGNPHVIPPHKVNYRANIWALKENGVDRIIAVNAVGGITTQMYPGQIILPDQIIDYTWGRVHSYYEEGLNQVTHVDFTCPYSSGIRDKLMTAAKKADIDCVDSGTYAATQGPRLETSAEIKRLEQDGCDVVGMTGMPEAALARELSIEYASICMVVNWAAGKSDSTITMNIIEENLNNCIGTVRTILGNYLRL